MLQMNRLSNGGLAYRCNHCGKVDRKGRLVGHILRDHVPQDRVPFYCTLCRFRCETRDDCIKHLTKYAGHVRAVGNTTNIDLNQVLIKSGNPWFVSSSDMTQVPDEDDDMFADQEEHQLPTWLRECRPLKRKIDTPVSAFSPISPVDTRQVFSRNQEGMSIASGPNQFPELTAALQGPEYIAQRIIEDPPDSSGGEPQDPPTFPCTISPHPSPGRTSRRVTNSCRQGRPTSLRGPSHFREQYTDRRPDVHHSSGGHTEGSGVGGYGLPDHRQEYRPYS